MSNATFKFDGKGYQVRAGEGGGLQLSATAPADPIKLTNQLQLPDGSVTEPSLTNAGDLNTGLFFPHQEAVSIVGDGNVLATFDGVTGKVTITGLTLPSVDGTAGQVLTTDGAGSITFADAASGGDSIDWAAFGGAIATAPIATAEHAIAIGDGSSTAGSRQIAIGKNARVDVSSNFAPAIAIGYGAFAPAAGVYIGYNAAGQAGMGGVCIGDQTGTYGYSISIGHESRANNSYNYAVAIGRWATAGASYSVGLGHNADPGHNYSVALGPDARTMFPGGVSYLRPPTSTAGYKTKEEVALSTTTTDGTPTRLAAFGNAALAMYYDHTMWHYEIIAMAKNSDSSHYATIMAGGLMRRVVGNGSGEIVAGSEIKTVEATSNAAIDIAVSVDNSITNQSRLGIDVIGLAGVTLDWTVFVTIYQIR